MSRLRYLGTWRSGGRADVRRVLSRPSAQLAPNGSTTPQRWTSLDLNCFLPTIQEVLFGETPWITKVQTERAADAPVEWNLPYGCGETLRQAPPPKEVSRPITTALRLPTFVRISYIEIGHWLPPPEVSSEDGRKYHTSCFVHDDAQPRGDWTRTYCFVPQQDDSVIPCKKTVTREVALGFHSPKYASGIPAKYEDHEHEVDHEQEYIIAATPKAYPRAQKAFQRKLPYNNL